MMNPICDIVILTWNKLEVTKDFIESLIESTTVAVRAIIVDNHSTDGTREYLSSLTPQGNVHFQIVLNEKNEGYVGGNNIGLKLTDAPYVSICNNDLVLTKGWLKEQIDVLDSSPQIGIVNPASNNLGILPAKNQPIDEFAAKLQQTRKGKFVEHPLAIGFCMAVKREVLKAIGGFSEEFYPLFFEDSDFSRRARQAGFKAGVAEGAYVWHHEHLTIDQLGDEKQAIFNKSKAVYLKKWGRSLRIGWALDDYKQLIENLSAALELARDCHYVHMFCRNLQQDVDAIFEDAQIPKFAGLDFKNFTHPVSLALNIAFKKKPFDLVIIKKGGLSATLKALGQKTVSAADRLLIDELKTMPAKSVG